MDLAELKQRYDGIRERMAAACGRSGRPIDSVRLVAVTKTYPPETIQAAIDFGIRDIGENRVQEIEEKAPHLHGDFALHLVGHLQTNKVARVLPHVQWIQSIDSERLVRFIHEKGKSLSRTWSALVEVNTSGEASKSGCSADACVALCEAVAQSPVLRFRGLMTIGPLGGSEEAMRRSFAQLRGLGEKIRTICADQLELSMGMSSDFEQAIEEGATMIRIGTVLFGERS
jgi:hypothetical protein